MLKVVRFLFVAIVAEAVILLAGGARADELLPQDFYGHYVGSGFTHGDFAYYELTKRDLDVEIGSEEDGFFVAWTSVFRPPGEEKPRRKSARVSFAPSQRSGIYVERFATDRIGEGLSWATINGKMLSIRILSIQDDGSYVVQAYHRILFEKGMILQFRSDHDGQSIRMVSARLTKEE